EPGHASAGEGVAHRPPEVRRHRPEARPMGADQPLDSQAAAHAPRRKPRFDHRPHTAHAAPRRFGHLKLLARNTKRMCGIEQPWVSAECCRSVTGFESTGWSDRGIWRTKAREWNE